MGASDLVQAFYRLVVMTSWSEFAAASPRLAADIEALFHQYGRGFGYLATVRRDGGPRVHPVSPVIAEGGLFCFVMDSPKRRDLDRDGRYALHAYPAEHSDDEAYVSGRARPVSDAGRGERLARAHRAAPNVDWRLYELDIEVATVTHRSGRDRTPEHRVWRAPAGAHRVRPRTGDGPSPAGGAVARCA